MDQEQSRPEPPDAAEISGTGRRTVWQFETIGTLRTCFSGKFGIPRQPGLAPGADGVLTLLPPFDQPEMVRGLADFSHVWLLFVFHATAERGFRPTVRPPRLGGQRRLGVLASRSPYRPNPLGMSVVELASIEFPRGRPVLHLRGVDILDGTPVLDVKPYLPYADRVTRVRGGFADEGAPQTLPVTFTPEALRDLANQERMAPEKFRQLIVEVLAQDPRPAYERNADPQRIFGMNLWAFNVRWQILGREARVLSVLPENPARDSVPGLHP